MTKDVRQLVRKYSVCQVSMYDNSAKPGLLQPLPILEEARLDISMDFTVGLPKSNGKDVIFVFVDRFSNADHFMPLSHPFAAVQVA